MSVHFPMWIGVLKGSSLHPEVGVQSHSAFQLSLTPNDTQLPAACTSGERGGSLARDLLDP